jgi:serine/threonine protein kinase
MHEGGNRGRSGWAGRHNRGGRRSVRRGGRSAARSSVLPALLDLAIRIVRGLAAQRRKGRESVRALAGNILAEAGAVDMLPAFTLASAGHVYIAPERIHHSDDERADIASDLYALGMVFYQLFTQSLPYDAADKAEWRHAHLAIVPRRPSSALPGLPPLIDAIVLKLLRKDPAERYLGTSALLVDLEATVQAMGHHGQFPWFEPGEWRCPSGFSMSMPCWNSRRRPKTSKP